MTKQKPRRPYRKLTDIRVDEISAVSEGAGVGTKIMMMKRNKNEALAAATRCLAMSVASIVDDSDCNKSTMLARTFAQFQDHINKVIKNNAERAEPDLSNTNAGMPDRRRRRRDDEAARLAAEMDTDADRDEDDESDEGGNDGESKDQLMRAERTMKGNNMQTHSELLSDVVKQYGITAFCKSVEQGDVRVSEHELCKLIEDAVGRENFSKVVCAQDERGIVLRKAIAATRDAQFLSRTSTLSKAQPQFSADRSSKPYHAAGAVGGPAGKPGRASLTPRVTGGRAATRVDNPKSALDQLQALAEAQRAQHTELTEAGAFAQVYADPKNAALVQKEREENRPTSAAWAG